MNILVFLKHVPDLVEDLEIDTEGKDLDRNWVRYIPSEPDEHAVEQAILLKERYGGTVTVAALDIGDIDDALFTASAKGADTLMRIPGDFEHGVRSAAAAEIYARIVREGNYDLVLTGVQSIEDLDGPVGARLAAVLDLPYVGVIRGIEIDETTRSARLRKEFPGGMLAVLRTELPCVVGIQSAELPPRYVPIARIRQASKNATIASVENDVPLPEDQALVVERIYKPEQTGGAEMLDGTPEEIAERLITIFTAQGILR